MQLNPDPRDSSVNACELVALSPKTSTLHSYSIIDLYLEF